MTRIATLSRRRRIARRRVVCVNFNGDTTSINCGSEAGLDDLHNAAFTAEAYVRANSWGEGGVGRIVGKGQWWLYIQFPGLAGWIPCATSPGYNTSNVEFTPDAEWHHVALTWDNATYNYPRLWYGGKEVVGITQNRNGAVISDAANDFMIGALSGGANTWDGDIGWIRTSDNIRYTTDFVPHARRDYPQIDVNTIEQWNSNDGAGATVTAQVTSPARDGVLSNGIWRRI